MAQLNKKHVQDLLSRPSGKLRASIYIPTHPTTTNESVTTSRTLLKNALQDIRNNPNYNERELGEVIDRIYTELYDNQEFWKHQSYGLAVLLSSNGYEFFSLPFKVAEQTHISDNYIIHPLLVAISVDASFYLLDVNTTKPRLFLGNNGQLKPVAEDKMPGSLEDEVGRDEYKPELQHQPGGEGGFHGHTTTAAADEDLRRYIKLLATTVDEVLAGKDRPLIIAGTVSRVSDIRKQLNYSHVMDDTVDGNHEATNANELYTLASPIVRQYLHDSRKEAISVLVETPPQHVAAIPNDIEAAAKDGRIDTLFLPIYSIDAESTQPDAENSRVIDLPSDIEEVETLATQTLLHGGHIMAVTRDAHEVLDAPKALLRY